MTEPRSGRSEERGQDPGIRIGAGAAQTIHYYWHGTQQADPVERNDAYYEEVRQAIGRGAPTLLLGTSTRALVRSMEKLKTAQRHEAQQSKAERREAKRAEPTAASQKIVLERLEREIERLEVKLVRFDRRVDWYDKLIPLATVVFSVLSLGAGIALIVTGTSVWAGVALVTAAAILSVLFRWIGIARIQATPIHIGRPEERTVKLKEGTAQPPLSDVKFLTVSEVASIMRVSKMTVYRLVYDGELEAIRVGHSFRVPESALSQYMGDPEHSHQQQP